MHPKKLFGLGGIRGVVGKYPITHDDIKKFGLAVAIYANDIGVKNIFISRDTRGSGEFLVRAFVEGLCLLGPVVSVQDLDVLPTHALVHFMKHCEVLSLAVMFTASHNHHLENGIKIFGSSGRLLSENEEQLLEEKFFSLKNPQIEALSTDFILRTVDARLVYLDFLLFTIGYKKFPEAKIFIDCANGSACYLVDELFDALEVKLSLVNSSPNGENINFNCGSLHPELASDGVLQSGAELGVVLDGDADRIVLIDETGVVIHGDFLIAFLALELAEAKKLNKNRIVVTEYSNLALDEFLAGYDIGVIRVKNGERNVVFEMDANDYALGGEYTGHIIFQEYSSAGDGLLVALQVMKFLDEKKVKPSHMRNLFKLYPSILINVRVREKIPFEEIVELKELIDSTRMKLGNTGRLILRYSGTEDVCRIMIEGYDREEIARLARKLEESTKKHLGL